MKTPTLVPFTSETPYRVTVKHPTDFHKGEFLVRVRRNLNTFTKQVEVSVSGEPFGCGRDQFDRTDEEAIRSFLAEHACTVPTIEALAAPFARLVRSEAGNGWGRGSGYARYTIGGMKWGVEVAGYTEHFKRKLDAVACFEFVTATGWNGKGDLETAWRNWAFANGKKLPEGFKGIC